jgi:hypothetical protein
MNLMLQKRIYRGDSVHQGEAYPGQHQAIIDPELWQIVQDKLAANRHERLLAVDAAAPSPLTGLIVRCRWQPYDADPCRQENQTLPILRLGVVSSWRSLASNARNAHPGG